MDTKIKNVTEYPLSSYQKDVWLEQCMYPGKPIYNIGGYTEVKGEINLPVFGQSLQVFINRNDMMRAKVIEKNGEPYLRISSEILYELPIHDFSGKENPYEFCKEWMQKEFLKPFDMEDILFQFALLKWSDNQYFLFSKVFHLIIDGWGFVLSYKQIVENYNELFIEGKIEEKQIYSYRDFQLEEQGYLDSKSFMKDREYWMDKYQVIPEPLFNQGINGNDMDKRSIWSGSRTLKIERALYNRIIQISEEKGCSVFHFVLGTLFTYFSRVCDKDEVVIGVPVLNRSKAKYKQTMGHFANVIPLRISPKRDMSFNELIIHIKNELMECYRHMRVSTGEIYRSVFSKANEKGNLFDISLSYEKHEATEKFINTEVGRHVNLMHYHERNALTVYLREYDDAEDVYMDFAYQMDAFEKFIPIENVTSHYEHLLRQVVENSENNISEIGIVPEYEQKKMIVEFNKTAADYSKYKAIHTLFEEQVSKYPQNIGVCLGEEKLTYSELNHKANQLARVLRDKGVKRDDIIAIMTERSFEMIIGMLGILKAGGAYLTIDPGYPSERIKYMLEDSASGILLTQKHLKDKAVFEGEVIQLDDSRSYKGQGENLENRSDPEDLAYIIYTSGSTGKPKGVMVRHRGIANLQAFFKQKYQMSENDRMLQFASSSFDASVWEIFTSLLTGAALYLIPKETVNNLVEFENYVNENGITIALLPPTYLSRIEPGKLRTLTRLITGGSAITKDMVKQWKDGLTYINAYGPTEYSVITTTWTYKEEGLNYASVPIGSPVNNTRVYILDKNGHILPIGAAGELCIAGDGLARGYLNRAELTAEKFVANPYEDTERMYRTGDLARWLTDGNIEFLGRIDDQVKIRGFRIELGEIESQLLKLPQVKEAAAVARDDSQGNKYIAAYIVSEEKLSVDGFRAELLQELPDYMVPSYFLRLDRMPLTTNGKIDRKALPEPDRSMDMSAEFVAPRDTMEETISKLWENIFKIERVGIKDNFFALGGDSLNAIVLSSEIHKEFNINIPLKEIFARPTVLQIAEYLKNAKEDMYASIKPVEKAEYYPMSSAQKRVYVLSQLEDSKTVYNMPGAVVIEGSMDAERVEAAFRKFIRRHETLRTSFEMMDGEPVQRVHEQADFTAVYKEAAEENIEDLLNEFIKPFDLSIAPLLRVGLVKTGENRHVLLIDMHHIISDGVSMEILVREFSALYEENELDPLRLQYRDYSAWQTGMYEDGTLKQQGNYWQETFEGEIPVLDMPLDYLRPALQSFEGDRIRFNLDSEVSEKLGIVAKENGATMYMVLLAAYNTLLYRYTGQEDIIVGSPIAGRPHADLQNIIGMFVNTLAMRNFPQGGKTFAEFLAEVRERALDAYENQDYPFEELVEKLNLKRDVSRSVLFDTFFALQNVDTAALKMGGLTIIPYNYDVRMSKFDIALTAKEEDSGINFELAYCTRLFGKETMSRIASHYVTLLEEIARNPQVRLKDLRMLTKEELRKIVYGFNEAVTEYPKDKTIPQIFEEQAEKTPDRAAVEFEENCLTYGELNARSNQLARELRKKGAGPGKTVGLMVERSVEMMVGIMAVLKAGSAYLPIDPLYPEARIKYMLEDSKTGILLTQTDLPNKVQFAGEILDLKDEKLYQEDDSNLAPVNTPEDLAYVIYTSGTTGKPKGVMIEHRNVLNLTAGLNKHIYGRYDKTLKVALVAPYVFDASVKQIFPALLLGHTLCIVPEEARLDGQSLLRYYTGHSVDVSDGTPTHIRLLENAIPEGDDVLKVKHFVIGGEALGIKTVRSFYDRLTGEKPKITNVYGPTECCVDSTLFLIENETVGGLSSIPIGVPLYNDKVYILGKNQEVLPVGAAGELYISGDGVGRGYLNNAELTEGRFVENPFIPDSRMYRTGDLARWLPDGNIEFLGRIDYQVKIRGYRIELGEIENQLLKHESVKEAVVIDREDTYGTKYLCAYVVGNRELKTAEFREHLLKALPDYMVPSYFLQLEGLPVTFNGKLDRKSLPEPEGSIDTGTEYVAPEGEVEEKLAGIWQEVLKMDRVGAKDNFFELGGHSLKATVIASRVHKEFNTNIPLKEIFTRPTVREMAEYIKTAKEDMYASIQPVEKAEYYPMSSAQKRVYILSQLEDSETVYNMPGALVIEGSMDVEKAETAFKKFIRRHETLRTSFEMMDGEPVQRVHEEADFTVVYKETAEEKIEDLLNEFIKPFDLSIAPLLRVGLVKTGENRHVLLFDMHHIISDGVSMEILVREFSTLYEGKELKSLRLQYRDYSAWQNKMYEDGTLKQQENHWLETFEGEIPVLNMPLDYPRPAVQSFEGDRIRFSLDREISEKLNGVAKENGATMYMLLLAAYNTLLYRYTGQEDIIVGSPIAGRPHADLQNIIGMFVNTLAMRNFPQGEKTFAEFLAEVREKALGAYENQDYPFEELVEKLKLKRDVSRSALFDTFFALQNVDTAALKMGGLTIIPYNYDVRMSKFDIALTAKEEDSGINFELAYCTRLFGKETMSRIASHYVTLLEEIARNPQVRIKDLRMLGREELHKIVYGFNEAAAEYPKDKTISRIFEEQAERMPDRAAVEFEENCLTYGELNARSNQLARELRKKGAGPDKTVGLMVERSVEMMVGIMAVLKAGGAYLPIDPLYPEARIKYMLEDSKTGILLTQTGLPNKVQFAGEILDLKDEKLYQEDDSNLAPVNTPDNLAYVIYTSGTTGKPKGVMIEHRNVLNLTAGLNKHIYGRYDKALKVALVAPYVFDASVKQIFPALLLGHTLCIVPEEARLDGTTLIRYYTEHSVDVSDGTPTHIRLLENAIQEGEDVLKVKHFIIGGEALGIKTVKSFYDRLAGEKPKITNVYGPTECCVDSTLFLIESETVGGLSSIPIGVPLYNDKIYILGKNREVLPVGAAGELYISGDGVGRGYLNNAELTEGRFVKNPFVPGSRMYRTGDLARWLPDGNAEFLGRIDYQVKIRGYRIELGEIENQLLKHESVREAVVIDREDAYGTKYLCAYTAGKVELTAGELRDHLLKALPEYMVPSYFIRLEKLPVTFNGKLDRKTLPEPEGSIDTGVEYVAPEGAVEEKLAGIWEEVLKTGRIGVKDNFFELGGHSLKATVLVSRIHKEFNINIPLKEIFARPTVRETAEYIKTAKEDSYASIQPVEKAEYYPMSSAQKRVYVLSQLEDSKTVYNMPGAVVIEGSVDVVKVEAAFQKFIKRHETLRTSFEMLDGEPVQRVHEEADFRVVFKEVTEEKIEDLLREFVKPFDLSIAPLLRVGLVKTGENRHVLLFDMHHIISDGVSMEILVREFSALYEGKELNSLRLQYRDYSAWQNKMYEAGILKQLGNYWLETFKGEIPVLNMPFDYQRPAVQSFEGDKIRFNLSREVSEKLSSVAKENRATMYMVLLAAYNTLLYRYTGQEDIIVGSPIAGRPHADLQNIIGMFVNTLAMRNFPQGEKTFAEFLAEVREKALGAYENKDYPFEELVEKLGVKRDVSRNALFDTLFALQNMDRGVLEIDGLKVEPYENKFDIAKFDTTLVASETEEGISFELGYCTRLFKKETMEALAVHFINILEAAAQDSHMKLKDIKMLDEEEQKKILYSFNETEEEYPKDSTIHGAFEEQVRKWPEKAAVVFGESKLSYRELNKRANKLAKELRSKGIGTD
ncbi:MAG: amino acid adenylation domain-containing protein, partial [Anaerocolumna sp.]